MKAINKTYLDRVAQRAALLLKLQEKLDYSWSSNDLLDQALTHSSALRSSQKSPQVAQIISVTGCNERLEFLGDAVLDSILSDHLFSQFPKAAEGELSKMRARLVCEQSLSDKARELKLPLSLLLGPSEFRDGLHEKDPVLADAFEALVAAVYRDGGYPVAKSMVLKLFRAELSEKHLGLGLVDYKTELQERYQAAHKDVPEYQTENVFGAAHNPLFEVGVYFRGDRLATGRGATKKKASQEAAKAVLESQREERPHD